MIYRFAGGRESLELCVSVSVCFLVTVFDWGAHGRHVDVLSDDKINMSVMLHLGEAYC